MDNLSMFEDKLNKINFDFSKLINDEKNTIKFIKSYNSASIDGFFYKPLLNGDLSYFKSFFEKVMNIK